VNREGILVLKIMIIIGPGRAFYTVNSKMVRILSTLSNLRARAQKRWPYLTLSE
jgi:hypothetical protein